jgi:hypothetical protein
MKSKLSKDNVITLTNTNELHLSSVDNIYDSRIQKEDANILSLVAEIQKSSATGRILLTNENGNITVYEPSKSQQSNGGVLLLVNRQSNIVAENIKLDEQSSTHLLSFNIKEGFISSVKNNFNCLNLKSMTNTNENTIVLYDEKKNKVINHHKSLQFPLVNRNTFSLLSSRSPDLEWINIDNSEFIKDDDLILMYANGKYLWVPFINGTYVMDKLTTISFNNNKYISIKPVTIHAWKFSVIVVKFNAFVQTHKILYFRIFCQYGNLKQYYISTINHYNQFIDINFFFKIFTFSKGDVLIKVQLLRDKGQTFEERTEMYGIKYFITRY